MPFEQHSLTVPAPYRALFSSVFFTHLNMHIRLTVEHLDDLLADVERSIRVNMDFVNRYEYAEASGHARGGLLIMRQRLEKLKQYNTHEDTWDYADEEDAQNYEQLPEFPSIYK